MCTHSQLFEQSAQPHSGEFAAGGQSLDGAAAVAGAFESSDQVRGPEASNLIERQRLRPFDEAGDFQAIGRHVDRRVVDNRDVERATLVGGRPRTEERVRDPVPSRLVAWARWTKSRIDG